MTEHRTVETRSTYDRLQVVVHEDSKQLAIAAANDVRKAIKGAVESVGRAAIVLATGNSQIEFLAQLVEEDLNWSKVSVLHMDEYVGVGPEHPASFQRYLTKRVVERVNPVDFYGIRGDAEDIVGEIQRYQAILVRERPVVCVLGIGENGHLAFNDPPADFGTAALVHQVTLDRRCRQQQVDEGYFPDIGAVPGRAITLTVPALLSPPTVVAVVPERRKAGAVRAALEEPISPDCPASALRTAGNAVLHLDRDSASELTTLAGDGRSKF